jgi:hypothetical protein
MIGFWNPRGTYPQGKHIAVGRRSLNAVSFQIGNADDGREIHLTREQTITFVRQVLEAIDESQEAEGAAHFAQEAVDFEDAQFAQNLAAARKALETK